MKGIQGEQQEPSHICNKNPYQLPQEEIFERSSRSPLENRKVRSHMTNEYKLRNRNGKGNLDASVSTMRRDGKEIKT